MAAESNDLYRLVVQDGPEKDRRIFLTGERIGLWRRPDGLVAVDAPDAGAMEAEVYRKDGEVRLRAGGAAPITVNGESVAAAILSAGDLIRVGEIGLLFERVEPLPAFATRRRTSMQVVAAAAMGVVLLVQIAILALFSRARPNELTLVAPKPPPSTETTEPAMSAEERTRLNQRLAAARRRLQELETDQASQSVEEMGDGTQSAKVAEEMGVLRARVDALGQRIEPEPPPALAGGGTDRATEAAAEALPEDPAKEARRLLTQARLDIAAGNLDQADRLLQELQSLDPEMVSGYVTRARLMERQGRLPDAVAQWEEALRRTAGTPFYEEATAERTRLSREIQAQAAARAEPSPPRPDGPRLASVPVSPPLEAPAAPPAPAGRPSEAPAAPERRLPSDAVVAEAPATPPPAPPRDVAARSVAPSPVRTPSPARTPDPRWEPTLIRPEAPVLPRLRIVDVQRERFQNRENYEEIRLVRVVLQPRKRAGELDPSRVRVDVQFYDRDRDTSAIEMSRVPTPKHGLRLDGDWGDLGNRTLTAMYMVRDGFRDLERTTYGQRRQYYGYVVRVYYDGELQDEHSFPASLLVQG